MTKPHIVLITIDAWRADHFGYISGDASLTPNLDRLARHSRVFANAFTNGGWTLPAMTALLSSTHVSMYGGNSQPVQCGRPWLPEILRMHGYVTAGFTTNPCCGVTPGFDRGFDRFDELRQPLPPPEILRTYASTDVRKLLRAQTKLRVEGWQPGLRTPHLFAPVHELVDHSLNWLHDSAGSPTFMWLHVMDLHQPLRGSRRSWGVADTAHAWRLFGASQTWMRGARVRQDDSAAMAMVERYRAAYRDELRTIDQHLGRLLDGIRARLAGDVITVITGDHGESFGEHGYMFHSHDLFDELLRVPLLMHGPGIAPRIDGHVVQHLDVAPTLLTLAGLTVDAAMLGQVLSDESSGADDEPPSILSERVSESRVVGGAYMLAIRTGRYKYVYDFDAKRRSLYDLSVDPGEQNDIADRAPAGVLRAFDQQRLAHVSRGLIHNLTRHNDQASVQAWQDSLSTEALARLEALGYLHMDAMSGRPAAQNHG